MAIEERSEADGGVEREALMEQWRRDREAQRALTRPPAPAAAEPASMEFDPDDDGLGPVEGEPAREPGLAGPGRRRR